MDRITRAQRGGRATRVRRLSGATRALVTTLLILAGLLVVPGLVGVAAAAVFNVTGTIDGTGSCTGTSCTTLRSAILASNTAGGPNTINLPAGTYTLTSMPSGSDDGKTGDLHVTADVTIAGVGDGQGGTAIVGDGDRVFDISASDPVGTSGHHPAAGGHDGSA